MIWKYYEPKFEYEEKFQDVAWPWAGHKRFAYDLVANMKPKKIVELGTHYGTSLWSFSQAVKDHKIDAGIYAIDTWQGEEHAGFYGEEVLKTVDDIKNTFYPDLKINLIKKTFDDALGEFKDGSIDILHIDGLHTYEAVKHDFESWLPKVKAQGIILFHDIEVAKGDFGVYKLWDELKKSHISIEFHHSFGLGVLFKNADVEENIAKPGNEWQRHYSYIHEMKKIQSIQQHEQKISTLYDVIRQKDAEIELMKFSKFWKLRDIYLKYQKHFFK